MKVGLFGGRFDPIHTGHLLVAEEAREALALDEVWFIPSKDPPHKAVSVAAAHRYRMALLATAEHPHFRVSEAELERDGTSYTVDTVEALVAAHPEAEFCYLVGIDAYAEIQSWHRARELVELVRMVALPRPGFSLAGLEPYFLERVTVLETPLWEISGSDVRARLSRGESARYLVPQPVLAYLHKHRLYAPEAPQGAA